MDIKEWCIAVLKGRASKIRFTELYNLSLKHYSERTFSSEEELFDALNPFKEFFSFEDFKYDYVTFEEDEQKDLPLLELAKDVLRTHSNRYTLSVLCRKMNESNTSDAILDDTSLKTLLLSRKCFIIEERSITYFTLSTKGEEYDIEPISFTKPAKSEEERQKEAEEKLEKKRAREQEKLAKEQENRIRKAILEELKEKKLRRKQKLAEHKEERRIESIKMIIIFYQINDETTLKQLYEDKLIRKNEYERCVAWHLETVGDVYEWVKNNNLAENMDRYRKHTVERMLKIASFYSPEYARLIPKVKFSGIREARRSIKLSQDME